MFRRVFRIASVLAAVMFSGEVLSRAQTVEVGEFSVQSFRRLEWDLDARTYHPMLDQNGKKAALIKVVTSAKDFDFDVGAMGVVGVCQEVGEIWLYVPGGVRKISIKHEEYGVIRDYVFPDEIESAVTYEMMLRTPAPTFLDLLVSVDSSIVVMKPRKVLGLTVSSVYVFPDNSAGLMLDYVKHRWGGYFKAVSSFKNPSASYECYSDGTTGDGYIWTTGRSHISFFSVSAGAVYRPCAWLDLGLGAGYGSRLLLWEDSSSLWANVIDRKVQSVAADVFLRVHFSRISFSVGYSTIGMSTGQCMVGVGYLL